VTQRACLYFHFRRYLRYLHGFLYIYFHLLGLASPPSSGKSRWSLLLSLAVLARSSLSL
jgi:hypothetical protein